MTIRILALALATVLAGWISEQAVASGQVVTSRPETKAPVAAGHNAARQHRAMGELEAVTMQALVAPMLRSSRPQLFGAGIAERQWQSMLADQLARSLAASGRLRLLPSPLANAAERPSRTSPDAGPAGAVRTCRSHRCDGNGGWHTTLVPAVGPTSNARSLEDR